MPKRAGKARPKPRAKRNPATGGEVPSPAWVRMMEKEKARRERQDANRPSTAQREADSSPERQGVSSGSRPGSGFELVTDPQQRSSHLERGCPGCLTPGWIKDRGWPDPQACKFFITPLVECRDTASAADGRHHHACAYWDHYPKETPF